jgi:hypothetical protein
MKMLNKWSCSLIPLVCLFPNRLHDVCEMISGSLSPKSVEAAHVLAAIEQSEQQQIKPPPAAL